MAPFYHRINGRRVEIRRKLHPLNNSPFCNASILKDIMQFVPFSRCFLMLRAPNIFMTIITERALYLLTRQCKAHATEQ